MMQIPCSAGGTDPQISKGWEMLHNYDFQKLEKLGVPMMSRTGHSSAWDELLGLEAAKTSIGRVEPFLNIINADIKSEPKNYHLKASYALILLESSQNKHASKFLGVPVSNLQQEAFHYANEAVALAPNDARSLAILGSCYAALESKQEAASLFDKALQLAPTDIDVNELAALFYSGTLYDSKKAIQCYERLTKAYPNTALFWTNLAYSKVDTGDLKGALQNYEIALQKDPNCVRALQLRAALYQSKGQWLEAINDRTKLIKYDPKSQEERALCYEQLHQYDKALADYNAAILNRNQAYARECQIEGVKVSSKGDAYEPIFQKRQFGYRHLFMERVGVYEKLGKYDEAIASLNDILKADPTFDVAMESRQEIYRKKGRYKEALSDLNKLLAIRPVSEWFMARADVYSHLGQKDKAALDTKRAAEYAIH